MKIGTKSILYGAHCFFLHPLFLAIAWTRLYGFPWDPRLWVAFAVHDLGYWGKPNIDGPEGETHPLLGAKIMGFLFDWNEWTHKRVDYPWVVTGMEFRWKKVGRYRGKWYLFTACHSRFLSKEWDCDPSPLCAADKLATCLTPRWLYLPMIRLSGEAVEYMEHHRQAYEGGKYKNDDAQSHPEPAKTLKEWHGRMTTHMSNWAYENRS